MVDENTPCAEEPAPTSHTAPPSGLGSSTAPVSRYRGGRCESGGVLLIDDRVERSAASKQLQLASIMAMAAASATPGFSTAFASNLKMPAGSKNYGKDKMNFLQRKQLQTEIDAHNAAVKKIKAEKKSKKSNQQK